MRKLVYLIMAMLPVLAVSCTGNVDPDGTGAASGESELTITVDKDIIQTGVDKAAVTVRYKGEVIEDGVIFYLGDPTDIKTIKSAAEYMDGHSFSTSEAGAYSLFALYNTYKSSAVTITAIPVAVPATPDDPQPQSTDFMTRCLLIQFTGAGCGFCPEMMNSLRPVLQGETDVDPKRVVRVACHNHSASGYTDLAEFDTDLTDFSANFPSLNCNLSDYTSAARAQTQVVSYIYNAYSAMTPKAGLAMNFSVIDRQAILKVSVKAGVEANYRVGGILIEDGLEFAQYNATADWMNVHDACIRWMDAGSMYNGHSLGAMKSGDVRSYVFIWNLDDIAADKKANPGVASWSKTGMNATNLRAVAYVTLPDVNGKKGCMVVNALATTSNSQIIPFA